MKFDYDLVIIGHTPEGIYAAIEAIYLKARVALVEQPFAGNMNGSGAIFNRTFSHFSHLSEQGKAGIQMGIYDSKADWQLQFSQIKTYAQEVDLILAERNSPAYLAALGIDFIKGFGEFCRLPQLAFIVNQRKLRSRSYLLATGCHSFIPEIPGLEEVGYLNLASLWQKDTLLSLPNQLVIVGDNPLVIELAQSLQRLGKQVTLVLENSSILPQEDPEISQIIQAHLEAEGVQILSQSPVIQVRKIDQKKWLQAGNQAIETDEIILGTQPQGNGESLNLEGVGVKLKRGRIQVNEKLQTTNPRIYACGSIIGGYALTNMAKYEAKLALKNALFLPLFKRKYNSIPWLMFTHPSLARVGLTEAQARRRYGEGIVIAKQYFKSIAQAHILGETTGFCKLILHKNGEILGAYIVGGEAGELIGTIALAIRHKINVQSLANFICPSLTLSEIIPKTVRDYQHQLLQRNKTLQNFLETLFIWRRT